MQMHYGGSWWELFNFDTYLTFQTVITHCLETQQERIFYDMNHRYNNISEPVLVGSLLLLLLSVSTSRFTFPWDFMLIPQTSTPTAFPFYMRQFGGAAITYSNRQQFVGPRDNTAYDISSVRVSVYFTKLLCNYIHGLFQMQVWVWKLRVILSGWTMYT